jgi:hypothetical protein
LRPLVMYRGGATGERERRLFEQKITEVTKRLDLGPW